MNRRRFKKATKYLWRRLDRLGAEVSLERCAEMIDDSSIYLESLGIPNCSPFAAARTVANEEADDLKKAPGA